MKREIAQFVKKKMFDLPTNQSGTSKVVRLLQPLSILERKWEHISMDFVFIKKKKKKQKTKISMDLYLGYQGHLGIMMLFGWCWIGLSISF